MGFPTTPLPLAPPAGWPPDVFDGNVIDAAHINAIRDSVFAWPGNVSGGGHTLDNVSSLVLRPGAGGSALFIANHAGDSTDWCTDANGDLSTPTNRAIGAVSSLGFADGTSQNTAFKGIAGTQTPWLQDIEGNRKTLYNLGNLAIWPLVGAPRLTIANDAGTNYDWVVGFDGNLSSPTGKAISAATVSTTGAMVAGSHYVTRGGQFWVQNAAGTVNLATFGDNGLFFGGVAAIRSDGEYVGPGIDTPGPITTHNAVVVAGGSVLVRDAAQTVNKASIDANGRGSLSGLDVSGDVSVVGNLSGRRVWAFPLASDFAFGIRSHDGTAWDWQTSQNGDLETPTARQLAWLSVGLREFSPGSGSRTLQVFDPRDNSLAGVQAISFNATVSTNSPRYDTPNGSGATGSFASQDGKTVHVDGGIIRAIV